MPALSLTVNGKPAHAEVEPRTLLVQLLRVVALSLWLSG